MNIFLNVFTAVFLLGILSITLMVNYFFITEIIMGRRKKGKDKNKLDIILRNLGEWDEIDAKPKENNMSKVNFLLQKLHDLRVLRSSCSDSNEGDFRVHLPEKDWDEIQRLVKEMRERP